MGKLYQLNHMFAINCETKGNYYIVEVLNQGLPFEDILERLETTDKKKANDFFVKMREKYRYCDDILIDG